MNSAAHSQRICLLVLAPNDDDDVDEGDGIWWPATMPTVTSGSGGASIQVFCLLKALREGGIETEKCFSRANPSKRLSHFSHRLLEEE